MYKSLYFSVIILIILLTGCASKTADILVVVDNPSINEKKDLLENKTTVVKIKKIESRPSQAMIDSAPSILKKTKKKQKLKKSSKPKKILKEKKKTSLVANTKPIKSSKPKPVVKTKNIFKLNTSINEISSVKKPKKEEELNYTQVGSKTEKKKNFPIYEVEKPSKKIERNNIKEESPEILSPLVSNKRSTENDIAAKKENIANSTSQELIVSEVKKQSLEAVTLENEQKRVDEIISQISGIKKTDKKQIDSQNDIKEQKNARVVELIKQMSDSIKAPIEAQNLDIKSDFLSQPQEIKKQELKSTDANKNQKRVEEIISQISGLPIPNKEETKSKEDIEKQKNARIEELIAQMNSVNKISEEKTPSSKDKIVDSGVILASNDPEVLSTKKLEPIIPETKNREKINTKKITETEEIVIKKDLEKKIILLKPIEEEKFKVEKDLYKLKKKVGDKVCRDATALVKFVCMYFTAYVEDVKNDKIKVRIVDSQCENNKYNGIGLYKNTILWDDHYHWKVCD